MKTFKLTILTPTKQYFEGNVSYLSIRNTDSVLGILPNHAPIITSVKICPLVMEFNGEKKTYACGKGLFQFKKDNTAILMVDSIESKEEIDLERAKAAKERAEKRLLNKSQIDIIRAEASLERALNRINVKE